MRPEIVAIPPRAHNCSEVKDLSSQIREGMLSAAPQQKMAKARKQAFSHLTSPRKIKEPPFLIDLGVLAKHGLTVLVSQEGVDRKYFYRYVRRIKFTGFFSSALSLLHFFGWEGSPTKIGYRRKGTLIRTSLLEDLVYIALTFLCRGWPS